MLVMEKIGAISEADLMSAKIKETVVKTKVASARTNVIVSKKKFAMV
jgi:hypothetical protein